MCADTSAARITTLGRALSFLGLALFSACLGFSATPSWAQSSITDASISPLPQESADASSDEEISESPYSLSYFGLFYGPSLAHLNQAYQPQVNGEPDLEQPVYTQNHLNLNRALTDTVTLSAQGNWVWQPVLDRYVEFLDPSLRLSHSELLATRDFSLYSDLRTYFPISGRSRAEGLSLGLQTFHIAQYTIPRTQLILGTAGSFRYNFHKKGGTGRRMESYLAPSLTYQAWPSLAFFTLFEMNAVNWITESATVWSANGTNLEPGLRWDITPRMMISPYVNFLVTDRVNWRSAQLGMMFYWNLL